MSLGKKLVLVSLCASLSSCANMPEMAQLTSSFASPSTSAENANVRIANGSDMKKLQKALNAMGMNAGTPDGLFGKKTSNAIKQFQRKNGLPVDGVPTFGLLAKATKSSGGGFSLPSFGSGSKEKKSDSAIAFSVNNCSKARSKEGQELAESLFSSVAGNMPIDIKPYLAGFCITEDKENLMDLYLYLAANGATHARLTVEKYNNLVSIYEKAGVDLGVRKDAFVRSMTSLNSDYMTLSNNRKKGTAQLLKNFDLAPVKTLLKNLPDSVNQLDSKYRTQAKSTMAEALVHSTSATFYLSRSVMTGKSLGELIDIKSDDKATKRDTGNKWDDWARRINIFDKDVQEVAKMTAFIAGNYGEIKNMLVASTYSVKTLTQDVKNVPKVNQSKAHNEVKQLRRRNGVTLSDFERGFEGKQLRSRNRVVASN